MKASTTSKRASRAAETREVIGRVHAYVRDVLEGRLVACEKVKSACRRFERDLQRSQSDPAYPWAFDEELAARPIRYIERYLRPTKGRYDRMEMLPWECFVEANLYGWVDKTTRLRRFREGLIIIAKKNGKSTLMAGNAGYGASADGEPGADIYVLANSKEQAGLVFETCRTQIMGSPVLRNEFKPLHSELRHEKTNSTIRRLASDSTKLDGLNPHMGIFDEIHEYRNFRLINVIKNGMAERKQPLALYITTMGEVLDGPLTQYYDRFTQAMNGVLPEDVADSMFCYIAELDSAEEIDQPDMWVKANPSMGVLIDLEQMKRDWAVAKLTPNERGYFVTKRLNLMADTSEAGFLDAEVIRRNDAVIDLAMLEGRYCNGGYDLSSREDFTAAALEFELDDGRFFWLCHSWVPRRKVELAQEKIDYYHWAMEGYLTIVEGEYIEQAAIYDWFMLQQQHYHIQVIGYDPFNAQWLNAALAKQFKTEIVRQGPLTLNDPMKDVREKALDGRIVSNRDAMLRWYMNNVRLRNDYRDKEKENWMPVKRNRYRKIDGFMACLNAHTVGMQAPAPMEPGAMKIRFYNLDD
ncbi:MAG: terminase TerL endonuclease subunit [Candidatus Limiplasma sp.]|nr:terminase TerL endonuclease subunit [Candidatus Limiplasma sp.]